MLHTKQIIKLFNNEVLKMSTVEWFQQRGYFLVVKAGQVVDIVEVEDDL